MVKEPSRIICIRTEELNDPHVSSVAGRCEECDRQVWIDKNNAPKVEELGLIVTCVRCFKDLLVEDMLEAYRRGVT